MGGEPAASSRDAYELGPSVSDFLVVTRLDCCGFVLIFRQIKQG